ncbi:MAG: hypothetical protein WCA12_08755, partial [Burkholderiales bacterium]
QGLDLGLSRYAQARTCLAVCSRVDERALGPRKSDIDLRLLNYRIDCDEAPFIAFERAPNQGGNRQVLPYRGPVVVRDGQGAVIIGGILVEHFDAIVTHLDNPRFRDLQASRAATEHENLMVRLSAPSVATY